MLRQQVRIYFKHTCEITIDYLTRYQKRDPEMVAYCQSVFRNPALLSPIGVAEL